MQHCLSDPVRIESYFTSLYTGNLPTGEHQLEVSVAGKLRGGGDLRGIESFSFSKDVEPRLVEIALAGRDSGDALIQLGGR